MDAAGNWSPWVETETSNLRLYQETYGTYSTGWTRASISSASGGTTRYASRSGRLVRFTVTGREIALVAPRSAGRGSARIYVDGVYAATVSLYRRSGQSRVIVFNHRFAASGSHQIEVRLLGTAGHPRFDVDGFLVTR